MQGSISNSTTDNDQKGKDRFPHSKERPSSGLPSPYIGEKGIRPCPSYDRDFAILWDWPLKVGHRLILGLRQGSYSEVPSIAPSRNLHHWKFRLGKTYSGGNDREERGEREILCGSVAVPSNGHLTPTKIRGNYAGCDMIH